MYTSFPDITSQQIIFFLNNYLESQLKDISFLKSKYENHNIGFDSILEFMDKIHFVQTKGNKLFISEELLVRVGDNFENITEVLLEQLFTIPNDYTKEIQQFLQSIKIEYETLIVTIDYKANYIFSNLRNFLTHVGLFYFNPNEKIYNVNPDFVYYLTDMLDISHALHPDKLLKIQNDEKSLGDKAELEILNYEKSRLKEFPYLINQINHVALTNVLAGYDIKSFESLDTTTGKVIPRYIEVKAVSLSDYSFHFSSNELKKASILKEKYFLYLLPVKGNIEFVIPKLIIIPDPVGVIFNSEVWTNNIEKYQFSLNSQTLHES